MKLKWKINLLKVVYSVGKCGCCVSACLLMFKCYTLTLGPVGKENAFEARKL